MQNPTYNDNKMHIALAANHRYLPGLLVTMVSMIRSTAKKENLNFHILSEGLTDDDKQKVISFAKDYGAPQPDFYEPDMTPIRTKFSAYKGSHAAFLRLFLCDVFPFDWMLYSDVDTLWLRDVEELWAFRDNSVSLLWCHDIPSICHGVHLYSKWNPDFNEDKYACSGVVLMNLKRLREINLVAKSAEFVEKWGTPFLVDQDILNYICRDDARLLPQHWDCMMPTKEAVNGLVYHFNGIGGMFNSTFSGWRPLYYPWFRFYYDFILKEPNKKVCGLFKRTLFWLLGSVHPPLGLIKFLLRWNPVLADNISRQLFFAWLWRHSTWKWGTKLPASN